MWISKQDTVPTLWKYTAPLDNTTYLLMYIYIYIYTVLLHLHCLLFGVLGWVSVQYFEISADVRRGYINKFDLICYTRHTRRPSVCVLIDVVPPGCNIEMNGTRSVFGIGVLFGDMHCPLEAQHKTATDQYFDQQRALTLCSIWVSIERNR